MLFDITLPITKELISGAEASQRRLMSGHIGTHFDVMDKMFPLEYVKRRGVFFDVSGISGRDIDICDIDESLIGKDMFAGFCTGFIEEAGYGTARYHHEHPQLSDALIDLLLSKEISIIGIDFAGVRRHTEHTPKDQYCADHGVFIVENLCGLAPLTEAGICTVYTFPMSYSGMTGLPCRVVAETV